eukprot:gene23663-biopygen7323
MCKVHDVGKACGVCSLVGHKKTAKAALQAPLPTTVEPIVCMALCHQTEPNGPEGSSSAGFKELDVTGLIELSCI